MTLSEDDIDGYLHLARTGSLAELQEGLQEMDQVTRIVDAFSGNTLLHMAAANGHNDCLVWLLDSLAGLQVADVKPKPSLDGTTKPAMAVQFINVPNAAGNTALHYAALNGHMDGTKLLVDRGADRKWQNLAQRTPRDEAAGAEKEEVFAYLDGLDQELDPV